MRNLFLSMMAILCLSFYSQAQEKIMADNAIGIRISEGSSLGLGVAVSYQRQMFGENNRLELNLGTQTGLVYDYANLYDMNLHFHWVFNIVDKLNWYAGPGLGVQFIAYDNNYDIDNQTNPFIGIEGGAEYSFDFPLQVSISIRPSYVFSKDDDDYDYYYYDGLYDNNLNVTVGIGARYTF